MENPTGDVGQIKRLCTIFECAALLGLSINPTGKIHCPFHNEKTPSCQLYNDGMFFCFGCNKTGDIFTLTQEVRGIDFVEALEWFCNHYGIERHKPKKGLETVCKRAISTLIGSNPVAISKTLPVSTQMAFKHSLLDNLLMPFRDKITGLVAYHKTDATKLMLEKLDEGIERMIPSQDNTNALAGFKEQFEKTAEHAEFTISEFKSLIYDMTICQKCQAHSKGRILPFPEDGMFADCLIFSDSHESALAIASINNIQNHNFVFVPVFFCEGMSAFKKNQAGLKDPDGCVNKDLVWGCFKHFGDKAVTIINPKLILLDSRYNYIKGKISSIYSGRVRLVEATLYV